MQIYDTSLLLETKTFVDIKCFGNCVTERFVRNIIWQNSVFVFV